MLTKHYIALHTKYTVMLVLNITHRIGIMHWQQNRRHNLQTNVNSVHIYKNYALEALDGK